MKYCFDCRCTTSCVYIHLNRSNIIRSLDLAYKLCTVDIEFAPLLASTSKKNKKQFQKQQQQILQQQQQQRLMLDQQQSQIHPQQMELHQYEELEHQQLQQVRLEELHEQLYHQQELEQPAAAGGIGAATGAAVSEAGEGAAASASGIKLCEEQELEQQQE
jgi:hypothetical protein